MYKLSIGPSKESHQADIAVMMAGIASEYTESIYGRKAMVPVPGSERYDWVATINGTVAGTVSVIITTEGYAILKNMFVDKACRGNAMGVALGLLNTAISRARVSRCARLLLGTMQQFAAAQRFYSKNRFSLVDERELPPSFPRNDVDTLFYDLAL